MAFKSKNGNKRRRKTNNFNGGEREEATGNEKMLKMR